MMKIDSGWLVEGTALTRRSPHCDDRPDPQDLSLIVIHNISLPAGVFGRSHIEALFMGTLDCGHHESFEMLRSLRVSAHVVIRRDGGMVQFVPFHRRAWHAGDSIYRGRSGCNDFSVGIELEGTDTWVYTYEQYASLVTLVDLLCGHYKRLTPEAIIGHSDIAPGRKSDPGLAFDWVYFRHQLGGVTEHA